MAPHGSAAAPLADFLDVDRVAVRWDERYPGAPRMLRTRAGERFVLERLIADTGMPEAVYMYESTANPAKKVALKVVAVGDECHDTAYYAADCAHIVAQRCLTPHGIPLDDPEVDKVYLILMELMHKDVYALQAKLSNAAKKKVLAAVYHAMQCLLAHGKAYTDLKLENVMVNLKAGAERKARFGADDLRAVKLVDLGSICPLGAQRNTTTFVPPADWLAYQKGGVRARVPNQTTCDEASMVWQVAVFVLELYQGPSTTEIFRRKHAPTTMPRRDVRFLFARIRDSLTPALFPGVYLENLDAYFRNPRRADVTLKDLLAPHARSTESPKAAARIPSRARAASLPAGTRLGAYKVVKLLGKGSYGFVYLVEKNKRLYAAKYLLPVHAARFVSQESAILRTLKDKCAKYFLCIAETIEPVPGVRIIVTDYEPDTVDLRTFIARHRGTIPAPLLLYIMKQLAVGLYVLHRSGIVHRDIKPSNILINLRTFRARYIDYGLACYLDDAPCLARRVGTLKYTAPELVWPGRRTPAQYVKQADIWSLGLVFYTLAAGELPRPWRGFKRTDVAKADAVMAAFAQKNRALRAPRTSDRAVRRAINPMLRAVAKRGTLESVVRQLNGGLARFANKKLCSPLPWQRAFLKEALAFGRSDIAPRKGAAERSSMPKKGAAKCSSMPRKPRK